MAREEEKEKLSQGRSRRKMDPSYQSLEKDRNVLPVTILPHLTRLRIFGSLKYPAVRSNKNRVE